MRENDPTHWIPESAGKEFAYSYKDEEGLLPGEDSKIMEVQRTHDSCPFGLLIKKAAHKAAFGNDSSTLQLYSTPSSKFTR